ncbi:histidine kinase [Virgisporangium aliadipatigenens]|uniref:Histidine kinase n=1 Tax=Virgisporangium aliadipatigenens TaxID=741659 RepID=A0A8J3YGH1_9ACTN|nr:ATP-binding protein [Virgisporangium aliadipatigenens]GIJ44764.1 histidine kinase [Virgisporangium aliadipatigenens]
MTVPLQQVQPAKRLLRDPTSRVVGGVAAGLARHLGAPVLAFRIGFFLLAFLDGMGAIMYAVFWAVLPADASEGRRNLKQLVPFLALAVGIALADFQVRGVPLASSVLGWLAAVVALGAGLIWHQASPSRRKRWSDTMPGLPWVGAILDNDRRGAIVRIAGGSVLVALGLIGIFAFFAEPLSQDGFRAIVNGMIFAVVGLAGVGLALAPVLWRMFSQLRMEREGRIREQERAELAAMIHDQVLHTLALIQRNSGDTTAVLRLARGQERTLRNWLYKETASPDERFSAALEAAAAEVEDTYAIAVETVVVGDCDVDDRMRALVQAAREALVNAGRHAGVATVSLYAEVEDDQASVFVRDRGKGFELSAVDEMRHGVRGSILGRMERHGGKAEIRSEPGDGTEVRLHMPRKSNGSDWLGSGEAPRVPARQAAEKG